MRWSLSHPSWRTWCAGTRRAIRALSPPGSHLLVTLVIGVMQLSQPEPRGLTPPQTEQLVEEAVAQAIQETQGRPQALRPGATAPRQSHGAAKKRPRDGPRRRE